jgi:hypothetical protein
MIIFFFFSAVGKSDLTVNRSLLERDQFPHPYKITSAVKSGYDGSKL